MEADNIAKVQANVMQPNNLPAQSNQNVMPQHQQQIVQNVPSNLQYNPPINQQSGFVPNSGQLVQSVQNNLPIQQIGQLIPQQQQIGQQPLLQQQQQPLQQQQQQQQLQQQQQPLQQQQP